MKNFIRLCILILSNQTKKGQLCVCKLYRLLKKFFLNNFFYQISIDIPNITIIFKQMFLKNNENGHK